MMQLILIDGENNQEYKLLLNSQDYDKATNDITFASSLLQHAKTEQNTKKMSEDILIDGGLPEENISSDHNDDKNFGSSENVSSDNNDDISNRWSHEAIMLLLHIYGEKKDSLVKGKVRQNVFWERIASSVNKEGYLVSAIQCRTKLGTLKRQYKKVKDHNKISGNCRKDWPYLQVMDELFEGQPWVEPIATASSTVNTISTSTSLSKLQDDSKLSRKPTQKNKINKVVDVLEKIREDRQRHHEEKLTKRTEALDLLKNLLQEATKTNE